MVIRKSGARATFQRCAEMRHRAGLSIVELMAKVGQSPSRSTYERLERGLPIRASSAFKIANAINSELSVSGLETFSVETEVCYV